MTTSVKTGVDHIESLRDGRHIFIDGEGVGDETVHLIPHRQRRSGDGETHV